MLVGLTAGAYAQGFVALDNIANSGGPTATAGGLFYVQPAGGPATLITGDFNAAFYGGTDSANLTLLHSFSGAGAVGTGVAGPGTFFDPTGSAYAVPGTTTASTTAFFQIEAWGGQFATYAEAKAQGALAGKSGVFSNPVASPPNTPPDLTGMPSVILVIPEPSSFALAGLGAAALLIFRRRK